MEPQHRVTTRRPATVYRLRTVSVAPRASCGPPERKVTHIRCVRACTWLQTTNRRTNLINLTRCVSIWLIDCMVISRHEMDAFFFAARFLPTTALPIGSGATTTKKELGTK